VNAVVFEHVQLSDLPAAWRVKLPQGGFARKWRVTVRAEEEIVPVVPEAQAAKRPNNALKNDSEIDPLFGMWRDREDMSDVDAYIRAIRAPRFVVDAESGGTGDLSVSP
jgi:hypothetical protein